MSCLTTSNFLPAVHNRDTAPISPAFSKRTFPLFTPNPTWHWLKAHSIIVCHTGGLHQSLSHIDNSIGIKVPSTELKKASYCGPSVQTCQSALVPGTLNMVKSSRRLDGPPHSPFHQAQGDFIGVSWLCPDSALVSPAVPAAATANQTPLLLLIVNEAPQITELQPVTGGAPVHTVSRVSTGRTQHLCIMSARLVYLKGSHSLPALKFHDFSMIFHDQNSQISWPFSSKNNKCIKNV